MLGATVELTSAVTFVLISGDYSNELLAKSVDDARDWNTQLCNAIAEVKKTPLCIQRLVSSEGHYNSEIHV
jgi:hypothetical protein